ncbi:MAG: alpha-glucuronidase family glycosyl hydrolase [Planctomycetaceae bacterium]
MTTGLLTTFTVWSSLLFAAEGPNVDVVVGPKSSELERYAARELSDQFTKLFNANVTIHEELPAKSEHVVLIGNPKSNPAVKKSAAKWPKLSAQGIVIQSFDRKEGAGIIVGGGSPSATLWGVYELGYQFGVRYALATDIFPSEKPAIKLDGWDIVREPVLPVRSWRTVNDFPIGAESWGADEQRKLFGQLAKLKFNRILVSVYAWQPFVHYESGGVAKSTAMSWYGEEYPIQGDTPGKVALNGVKLFENPDLAGKKEYAELTAAGVQHIRHVMAAAHDLGMTTALQMSPLEFTREFEAVIPGAQNSPSPNNVLIAPGAQQSLDDEPLKNLVIAQIRAYIDTYPDLDALYLTLPEFPEWEAHAEEGWKRLSKKHKLGDITLESLIEAASNRKVVASGERGRKALRGNIAALAFLNDILSDGKLLKRKDGKSVELVFVQIDPALYPLVEKILPKSAGMLNFVDYTARRVVENIDALKAVPAKKVPSQFIFTLADDNIGILPQIATRRIETIAHDLVAQGWQGFSTRMWIPACLDPTTHYLSRYAFDPTTTVQSAHDEYFMGVTGSKGAVERLWLAFGHLETATELIDQNDIGFAFPVPSMFMKHYNAEPVPEWWGKALNTYVEFTNELYRAHGGSAIQGHDYLFYYAKRSEFPLEYLTAVQAVREAGIAKSKGDLVVAQEKINVAIESIFNSMDVLSDVAQNSSDRALIAILDKFAYRPLLAELEQLEAAAAESK